MGDLLVRPQLQAFHNYGGADIPPDQHGDCFRTCIASVLDLDRDEVPNIHEPLDDHHVWWAKWEAWAATQDRKLCVWRPFEQPFGEYVLSCIELAPGKYHCVVSLDGRVVHDPDGGSTVGKMLSSWKVADHITFDPPVRP